MQRTAGIRLLAALLVTALGLQSCATAETRTGVYVAPLSEGAPRWIGNPAGIPVWSAKGDAIAWGGEDGLFVAHPEGGSTTRLTAGAIVGRPAWDPDGTALAYVDQQSAALVVREATMGEVLFQTPIKNDDTGIAPLGLVTLGGPSWSPDGSRIAFNCWDGNGDEVCVVGRDGSGRRQVTRLEPARENSSGGPLPVANVGPPAWAPDSATLAVAAYPERRGAASGVFVIDLDRGQARRISPLLPNSEIRWFPDGHAIVFSATADGRSDSEVVTVADGTARTLTESLPQGSRNPDPAPDGEHVAVASGRGIAILDSSGAMVELIDSGLRDRYPAWSPDGSAIAFAADWNPILSYD